MRGDAQSTVEVVAIKIEIWSDYICPFCYIGKRRFEAALAQFPQRDEVEIVFKSFELDPELERDGNPSVPEMLMQKYGLSREDAAANIASLTGQAQALGLDYRMAEAIRTNTFDAHRLTRYAAVHGKMGEMAERLLKAYFVDALHIGDHETLADLAAETGLDRQAALQVLADGAYGDEVRADEEEAQRLGIRGVPFFVFDRRYAVSGAQPTEVFLQTLDAAWRESDES